MADTEGTKILQVTDANFEATVAGADRPFLLDLTATWCGPCQAIAPVLAELATEYDGKAYIGKLDIDENPTIPTRYQVRSVPTLLIFKGGQVKGQLIGAHSRDRIAGLIDEALQS
jgi:thioredoxin 1